MNKIEKIVVGALIVGACAGFGLYVSEYCKTRNIHNLNEYVQYKEYNHRQTEYQKEANKKFMERLNKDIKSGKTKIIRHEDVW